MKHLDINEKGFSGGAWHCKHNAFSLLEVDLQGIFFGLHLSPINHSVPKRHRIHDDANYATPRNSILGKDRLQHLCRVVNRRSICCAA